MEAGLKRRSLSGERDEEPPVAVLDGSSNVALQPRGGGEDQNKLPDEEVGDDIELDRKVDRFFQIIRRLREIKESWERANKWPCNAHMPPPQWIPKFRLEDFASSRAGAQKTNQSAKLVSVSANHEDEQGAIVVDGIHTCASTATSHDQPQQGGIHAARNDVRQGYRGYQIIGSGAVEKERRGKRKLVSITPDDDFHTRVEQGSAGLGPATGGQTGSSYGAINLDLKLAL